jgi:hypothetical protein
MRMLFLLHEGEEGVKHPPLGERDEGKAQGKSVRPEYGFASGIAASANLVLEDYWIACR